MVYSTSDWGPAGHQRAEANSSDHRLTDKQWMIIAMRSRHSRLDRRD